MKIPQRALVPDEAELHIRPRGADDVLCSAVVTLDIPASTVLALLPLCAGCLTELESRFSGVPEAAAS